jgi:hypothetical protein
MSTVIGAINSMIRGSGKSRRQVSMDMKRNEGYLTATVQKKSRIRVDVLVEIANACGYELQLVGNGETIVIDNKPDE